uniref:Uncharacterized protein n=2 Tax=Ditylum brightwellii TaxID=49249 RepID=A0A6V2DX44_9STRA
MQWPGKTAAECVSVPSLEQTVSTISSASWTTEGGTLDESETDGGETSQAAEMTLALHGGLCGILGVSPKHGSSDSSTSFDDDDDDDDESCSSSTRYEPPFDMIVTKTKIKKIRETQDHYSCNSHQKRSSIVNHVTSSDSSFTSLLNTGQKGLSRKSLFDDATEGEHSKKRSTAIQLQNSIEFDDGSSLFMFDSPNAKDATSSAPISGFECTIENRINSQDMVQPPEINQQGTDQARLSPLKDEVKKKDRVEAFLRSVENFEREKRQRDIESDDASEDNTSVMSRLEAFLHSVEKLENEKRQRSIERSESDTPGDNSSVMSLMKSMFSCGASDFACKW